MKITTSKTPEGRVHRCALGELIVTRNHCVLFPAAFCGTVAIKVLRSDAVRGLREWRKITEARVLLAD